MTPLETEANPNIRVGPLRWGRPKPTFCSVSKEPTLTQKLDHFSRSSPVIFMALLLSLGKELVIESEHNLVEHLL